VENVVINAVLFEATIYLYENSTARLKIGSKLTEF
jgi:hypothetical protein